MQDMGHPCSIDNRPLKLRGERRTNYPIPVSPQRKAVNLRLLRHLERQNNQLQPAHEEFYLGLT